MELAALAFVMAKVTATCTQGERGEPGQVCKVMTGALQPLIIWHPSSPLLLSAVYSATTTTGPADRPASLFVCASPKQQPMLHVI